MPKLLNQKGIFPIILIIILTVVIAGVAGVVYQSRKEIKVRSDKTSEVTELKGSPEPSPESADVAADRSGKLAEKPFEQNTQTESSNSSMPKFSFYPPAGWDKTSSGDNIVVGFRSPTKDKIEEGAAWFTLQPDVAVFAAQYKFNNLEEALEAVKNDLAKSRRKISQTQKTQVNGQDAYYIESIVDLAELGKSIIEAQIKEEIKKSGTKISQDDVQKDIDRVLKKAKARAIGYLFYKDGYLVTVSGKALESFWGKRGPQLKQSMDTFKFE